jgi:type II secretory pathway component PulF
MPSFAYSGRTRGGQTVSGERAADSMDAAVAALKREQILVTRITPAKVKAAAKKAGRTDKSPTSRCRPRISRCSSASFP